MERITRHPNRLLMHLDRLTLCMESSKKHMKSSSSAVSSNKKLSIKGNLASRLSIINDRLARQLCRSDRFNESSKELVESSDKL